MTSTRARAEGDGDAAAAGAAAAGTSRGLSAAGRSMKKVEPSPTALSNVIRPPSPRTTWAAVVSPRPVPTPTGLVVKNGSKTCA
ncbi:MAG: hypothetical protein U0235_30110 [Polyangiaceae bacterium]